MKAENVYEFGRLQRNKEQAAVELVRDFLEEFLDWSEARNLSLTPLDRLDRICRDSVSDLQKTASKIVQLTVDANLKEKHYFLELWGADQYHLSGQVELVLAEINELKGYLYADFLVDPVAEDELKKAAEELLDDWKQAQLIDFWIFESEHARKKITKENKEKKRFNWWYK